MRSTLANVSKNYISQSDQTLERHKRGCLKLNIKFTSESGNSFLLRTTQNCDEFSTKILSCLKTALARLYSTFATNRIQYKQNCENKTFATIQN